MMRNSIDDELDSIRRLAKENSCKEVGIDYNYGIAQFRSRKGIEIHVFYTSRTVRIIVQHHREGEIGIFHYDVNDQQLADIFADPDGTARWGNTRNRNNIIPLESEENALRRHISFLRKERDFLIVERAEVMKRAGDAGFGVKNFRNRGASDSFTDGTPEVDLSNYRRAQTSTDVLRHGESQEAFDDNKPKPSSSMITHLLRQQTELTSQLETLLLKHSSQDFRGNKDASPLRVEGAASRTRGRRDGGAKNLPFKSQKSLVKPKIGSNQTTSTIRQRGNLCCYALATVEIHKEFGAAWSKSDVDVVALGSGYIIVYDNGNVSWRDVPRLLDAMLRIQNAQTQSMRYAVLGPDENFYVQFAHGKMDWSGPESFGEAVKRGVRDELLLVEKVAFGPKQGWLIVWSNGVTEHSNIPLSLEQFIESASTDHCMKDVSIGPNGEWFIIFQDNSVIADNLPNSLQNLLEDIQDDNGRIRQVVFGQTSTWYVRYWDGTIHD